MVCGLRFLRLPASLTLSIVRLLHLQPPERPPADVRLNACVRAPFDGRVISDVGMKSGQLLDIELV